MRAALLLALALIASSDAVRAEPVLLISIDGLRPGDVLEAEQRGLKLPNLTRFVREGAYATGVTGVLPTVTYPSHTTLLTGVSPAKHGIVGNTTFDPGQINQGGWYWYASDIKVTTLWVAAAKAGHRVGNIHWPVSVGAPALSWNLPQVWRSGHADDAKLMTSLATPGLVAELERMTGEAYAAGIDESLEGDEKRARFVVQLIKARRPGFLTAYFTSLDHEQHAEGPGTPKAYAVLERIDAIVGRLTDAQLAAHPDAAIAIVSDHGFETISRETNFFRAFIDAGLITVDAGGKVSNWEAMPWPSGGSVAIMLARPDDESLRLKVGRLLEKLAADKNNGIAMIAGREDIARMGGNPQASFYLNLAPDTAAGSFADAAALNRLPRSKGTHGYFPKVVNLQSTFLIMGKPIARGRNLGLVDMRAIAPTLAKILGAKLPQAELPPISDTFRR